MAYLAPSLALLRAEINRRWPGRDHTSDGWIGDKAHQNTRSDHNPNSRGSVNAIDIDEDGVNMAALFTAIKKHPSARYWIYERRLYHRDRGWQPEEYHGTSPHDGHGHLSIDQDVDAEQDTRSWGIGSITEGPTHMLINLRKGDQGPAVQALQYLLKDAGFDPGDADSDYGPKTAAAVLAMRKSRGSKATDGNRITPAAFSQLFSALAKENGSGRGPEGPAGKDGRDGKDGKDGVLTLPMNAQITGAITAAPKTAAK